MIPESLRPKLAFVIKNYNAITLELQDELPQLDPGNGNRLLAMAAVLEFADWSHLDHTRVNESDLARLTIRADELLQRLTDTPSSPISVVGELPCVLPKFYRSYYVRERSLNVSDSQQVRFSVTLAEPPGLCEPGLEIRYHEGFRRLTSEWRAFMLPSRMYKPLAVDHLADYAHLELIYNEPRIVPPPVGVLCVPTFVRDYWIASHWFNLDDEAQIFDPLRPMKMFDLFFRSVDPDTIYDVFHLKKQRVPADRPRLSRRAFLYLHLKLTAGRSIVSQLFFRHFHHAMCCGHALESDDGQTDERGFHDKRKNVYDCVLAALNHVQWLLWRRFHRDHATLLVSADEERIAATISRECFRGLVEEEAVLNRLSSGNIGQPHHREAVALVLNILYTCGALVKNGSAVAIASNREEGALLAILGAPLKSAFNV